MGNQTLVAIANGDDGYEFTIVNVVHSLGKSGYTAIVSPMNGDETPGYLHCKAVDDYPEFECSEPIDMGEWRYSYTYSDADDSPAIYLKMVPVNLTRHLNSTKAVSHVTRLGWDGTINRSDFFANGTEIRRQLQ
jgi:hypothetical protein